MDPASEAIPKTTEADLATLSVALRAAIIAFEMAIAFDRRPDREVCLKRFLQFAAIDFDRQWNADHHTIYPKEGALLQ